MEITDIRIKKVASEGKMKAIASVTFDNAFAVHDVKVIEGPEKAVCCYAKQKNS